jgi:hypothetical protein
MLSSFLRLFYEIHSEISKQYNFEKSDHLESEIYKNY